VIVSGGHAGVRIYRGSTQHKVFCLCNLVPKEVCIFHQVKGDFILVLERYLYTLREYKRSHIRSNICCETCYKFSQNACLPNWHKISRAVLLLIGHLQHFRGLAYRPPNGPQSAPKLLSLVNKRSAIAQISLPRSSKSYKWHYRSSHSVTL
jgi:hypothetical protein